MRIQGYWIKHEDTIINYHDKTCTSITIENGRHQLPKLKTQVEKDGYSTLTYNRGNNEIVTLSQTGKEDITE